MSYGVSRTRLVRFQNGEREQSNVVESFDGVDVSLHHQ